MQNAHHRNVMKLGYKVIMENESKQYFYSLVEKSQNSNKEEKNSITAKAYVGIHGHTNIFTRER